MVDRVVQMMAVRNVSDVFPASPFGVRAPALCSRYRRAVVGASRTTMPRSVATVSEPVVTDAPEVALAGSGVVKWSFAFE